MRYAELRINPKVPGSEQELYDETTDYIRSHYNRAKVLNRSRGQVSHECLPAASGQFYLRPVAFLRAPIRKT